MLGLSTQNFIFLASKYNVMVSKMASAKNNYTNHHHGVTLLLWATTIGLESVVGMDYVGSVKYPKPSRTTYCTWSFYKKLMI